MEEQEAIQVHTGSASGSSGLISGSCNSKIRSGILIKGLGQIEGSIKSVDCIGVELLLLKLSVHISGDAINQTTSRYRYLVSKIVTYYLLHRNQRDI